MNILIYQSEHEEGGKMNINAVLLKILKVYGIVDFI
jgi:hypothetical protein